MLKALYVGSFDPFTNGHYEILKQAEQLFEVTVVIASNPNKKSYFEDYLKVDTIEAIKAENTSVVISRSLTTDLFDYYNCDYIIRGLRNTTDYLYEENLYQMYKQVNPNIKVVYFKAESNVSSSLVRELFKREKDISKFVPYNPELLLTIPQKYLKGLTNK